MSDPKAIPLAGAKLNWYDHARGWSPVLDQVQAIFCGLSHGFYTDAPTWWFNKVRPALMLEPIVAPIYPYPKRSMVFASCGTRVVGFAIVKEMPDNVIKLSSLYVEGPFQHHGVASAMLRFIAIRYGENARMIYCLAPLGHANNFILHIGMAPMKIGKNKPGQVGFNMPFNQFCDWAENRPRPVTPKVDLAALPVQEACHRYNVQQCHICDDWECGDNTNPSRTDGGKAVL